MRQLPLDEPLRRRVTFTAGKRDAEAFPSWQQQEEAVDPSQLLVCLSAKCCPSRHFLGLMGALFLSISHAMCPLYHATKLLRQVSRRGLERQYIQNRVSGVRMVADCPRAPLCAPQSECPSHSLLKSNCGVARHCGFFPETADEQSSSFRLHAEHERTCAK